MRTKNQISLIHKSFYGIMLLGIFLSAFGNGNFSFAQAKGAAPKTPTVGLRIDTPTPKAKETKIPIALEIPEIGVQAAALPTPPRFLTLPFYQDLIHPIIMGDTWIRNYDGSPHEGVDYYRADWKEFPILAAADGDAIYVSNHCTWGNYIKIKHQVNGEKWYTLYAHLSSSPIPADGAYHVVQRGSEIGIAGKTGYWAKKPDGTCDTTNPYSFIHLHFELSKDNIGKGYRVDPYGVYEKHGTTNYPGQSLAFTTNPPSYGNVSSTIRIHANLGSVQRIAKLAISRDNFRWDVLKQLDVTIKADGWSDPIQLDGISSLGMYTFYLKPTGGLGEKTRIFLNPLISVVDINFSPNGENFKFGDANGDNNANLIDFSIWKQEYLGSNGSLSDNWRSDFNRDKKVDLVDFSIWKSSYLAENNQGYGWPEGSLLGQMLESTSSGPVVNLLSGASYNVGDIFPVQLELNTFGTPTNGSEMILRYDPGVLEVIDSDPSQSGIQIQAGTVYSNVSTNIVNPEEGTIWFSAYNGLGGVTFTGTAILATIQFRAVASIHQTEVSAYFSPNWTTDSNVTSVTLDQDQLQQVGNANFEINGNPLRSAPSVSIQPHKDNSQLDTVQLVIEANDTYAQVETVQFFAYYDNSWHLLSKDLDASDGWIFNWSVAGIAEQGVWLLARSYIRGGYYYDSEQVYYPLDKTSPTFVSVSFTPSSPTNTDFVWASVKATDTFSGVDHIEMYYNASSDGSDSGDWLYAGEVSGSQGSIGWDTSSIKLDGGTHRIIFLIQDSAGNWNDWTAPGLPLITYNFCCAMTNTPTSTRTSTPTATRTPSVRTFTSIAAQDGWILESSETSNKGGAINRAAASFILGDNATKKQYRGILSFSTGSLPDNAVITKVTLKVKKSATAGGGNPVAIFKGFLVDVKTGYFGATAALQAGDFQAAASKSYGPFNTVLVGGWYSLDLTGAKGYVNKGTAASGLTQLRLRFKLDDNNNAVANVLSLFSGNAPVAANRPQLLITYYLP